MDNQKTRAFRGFLRCVCGSGTLDEFHERLETVRDEDGCEAIPHDPDAVGAEACKFLVCLCPRHDENVESSRVHHVHVHDRVTDHEELVLCYTSDLTKAIGSELLGLTDHEVDVAAGDDTLLIELQSQGCHGRVHDLQILEPGEDDLLNTEADDDPWIDELQEIAGSFALWKCQPDILDVPSGQAGLPVERDRLGDPGSFGNLLVAFVQIRMEPIGIQHACGQVTDLVQVGPVPVTVLTAQLSEHFWHEIIDGTPLAAGGQGAVEVEGTCGDPCGPAHEFVLRDE